MIQEGFIGSLNDIWVLTGESGFFFVRQIGNDEEWKVAIFVKYRVKIMDGRTKANIGDFYYIVDVNEMGVIKEINLHYAYGNKIHVFMGPVREIKKNNT
jgi:hypothetical protein